MQLIDYIVIAAIFAAPAWWVLDGVRYLIKKHKAQ